MEEMTMTGLEREQYQAHLDFLRMEKEAFEARYIKGKADGKAEGKLEIAKTMLASGVAVAMIAQYTGLSVGEIEDFQWAGQMS